MSYGPAAALVETIFLFRESDGLPLKRPIAGGGLRSVVGSSTLIAEVLKRAGGADESTNRSGTRSGVTYPST